MQENNVTYDRSIISAFWNIIRILSKAVSIALSFSFIIYLLGLVRASSYFSSFGAKWILGELGCYQLCLWGCLPATIIFIALAITFFDITGGLSGKHLNIAINVCTAMLGITFASFLLQYTTGRHISAAVTAKLMLWVDASVSGLTLGMVAIDLDKNNYKCSGKHIRALFMIISCSIFATYWLGKAEGHRDKSPIESKLAYVELVESNSEGYRLVISNKDTLYLAVLSKGEPKIRIVKGNMVQAIYVHSGEKTAQNRTPREQKRVIIP